MTFSIFDHCFRVDGLGETFGRSKGQQDVGLRVAPIGVLPLRRVDFIPVFGLAQQGRGEVHQVVSQGAP